MASSAAQTITFSGTVTVGGTKYTGVTLSGVLPAPAGTVTPVTPVTPVAPVTPVTPAGTVPYPAALASGHTLLEQYLPEDLYAWRYMPNSTVSVTNGSGVGENPDSPRNVAVTASGGLSVLQLGVTSAEDCGVIQSPGTYPTSSGVIETLIRFSGVTVGGSSVFPAWSSFWLYGAAWPAGGEIDSVETQFGNSYVSYHYGSGGGSTASTNPWDYSGKTVQLSPENSTSAPVAPNIVPGEWTYVTLAFGKNSAGDYYVDVYYNGTLYCTISGPYVTGDEMWVTAGTGFGAATLGSDQTPYDQPGNVEIQYVRVFS
jgi:hypothetical protein